MRHDGKVIHEVGTIYICTDSMRFISEKEAQDHQDLLNHQGLLKEEIAGLFGTIFMKEKE